MIMLEFVNATFAGSITMHEELSWIFCISMVLA